MQLFYTPKIDSKGVLSEEESRHAIRVLRYQLNDPIDLVDGVGNYYKAIISNPNPKRCEFEVIEKIENFEPLPYNLHLAVGPTKNIDRFEWFVEKSTEIGVTQITPILSQFSERKHIKKERIEKIIVSAAKQSVKAHFPILNEMIPFEQFIKNAQASQKFIAHCYDLQKSSLFEVVRAQSDLIVMIGPEGDFSEAEIDQALLNNYTAVGLGSARLRTETAGIVACHTVNLKNSF